MKIKRMLSQLRRDFYAIYECEDCNFTEEGYIICNINPEHYKLKDFEFAIKNYSENEGMLKWLINNNYMQHPHFSFASGFVDIPVCYATNKLREMIIKICTKEVDT